MCKKYTFLLTVNPLLHTIYSMIYHWIVNILCAALREALQSLSFCPAVHEGKCPLEKKDDMGSPADRDTTDRDASWLL